MPPPGTQEPTRSGGDCSQLEMSPAPSKGTPVALMAEISSFLKEVGNWEIYELHDFKILIVRGAQVA